MILTTYNADPLYLLDLAPDWINPFKADISLIVDTESGISNRETRRAYSATLRFKSRFTITATGSDARRLTGALRNYQLEPVAIPLWPASVPWSDRATNEITGGLKLAFKSDFSQWEIYEGVEPTWPLPDDNFCPLIVGRLEKRSVNWLKADTLTFNVEHTETSKPGWAITLQFAQPILEVGGNPILEVGGDPILEAAFGPPSGPDQVFSRGPQPSGGYSSNPFLLPFQINFDQPETSFTVNIFRQEIGFGRAPNEIVYSQANAREQGLSHVLKGADIGALLYFFLTQGGGASFWASSWTSAAALTADISAADTVLNVSDTSAVTAGDWLAFTLGSTVVTGRVLSKTATTITLIDAIGANLPAAKTLVSHLLLVRFQNPTISVAWPSPEFVDLKLPLREVPAEYTPAADETLGTTLGALKPRCFIYEWSMTLNGNTYVTRYTSYESSLTLSGNPCTAEKITHDEIKQGINLDRDEATVTMPAILSA